MDITVIIREIGHSFRNYSRTILLKDVTSASGSLIDYINHLNHFTYSTHHGLSRNGGWT